MSIAASRRSFMLGALAVAGCQSFRAASSVGAASAARLPVLDRLLRETAQAGMFDGVVKIDRAGEIIFDEAYGLANYDRGWGFASNTRFCIASLSKTMTDAALGALVERGAISLETSLDNFMPTFPSAERITIRQITEHRSGIPHTNAQPWGDGSLSMSRDEVLRRLAQLPLDFEPGLQRSYSNGGYAVLARVLEHVHGKPYAELMRELVFDPLGMSDAGEVLDSRAPTERLAKGYQPGLTVGARANARYYATETRQGGGSLYASANDVMAFFRAFYRHRLPGAAALPELLGGTQPRRAADGRAPGYYMDVYYVADADLIVSSTANNYASEPRWAENIAKIVLEEPALFTNLPAIASAHSADSAWLGRYRYDNPNYAQDLEIRAANGATLLLTDRASGDARALAPLANGGYLDPLYYWMFTRENDGRLIGRPFYDAGYTVAMLPNS